MCLSFKENRGQQESSYISEFIIKEIIKIKAFFEMPLYKTVLCVSLIKNSKSNPFKILIEKVVCRQLHKIALKR